MRLANNLAIPPEGPSKAGPAQVDRQFLLLIISAVGQASLQTGIEADACSGREERSRRNFLASLSVSSASARLGWLLMCSRTGKHPYTGVPVCKASQTFLPGCNGSGKSGCVDRIERYRCTQCDDPSDTATCLVASALLLSSGRVDGPFCSQGPTCLQVARFDRDWILVECRRA